MQGNVRRKDDVAVVVVAFNVLHTVELVASFQRDRVPDFGWTGRRNTFLIHIEAEIEVRRDVLACRHSLPYTLIRGANRIARELILVRVGQSAFIEIPTRNKGEQHLKRTGSVRRCERSLHKPGTQNLWSHRG